MDYQSIYPIVLIIIVMNGKESDYNKLNCVARNKNNFTERKDLV